MPTFTFQLDPLLRLREREEQKLQAEVARIERQRLALEADLRQQQERVTGAREVLRSSLTGTLDAQHVRMYASTAMQQMRRAQRILPELALVHRRLEEARVLLVEAARKRRALERLREKRKQAWVADLERAEAAALDDLVTGRQGVRS